MRLHGTLTKWNDDRGFGFITPAKGTSDIFVHISAFPREGGRPRPNELISFETEAGRDGKPRAVRVMRPRQPRPEPATAPRDGQRSQNRKLGGVLGAALLLLAIAAIGIHGYSRLSNRASWTNEAAAPTAAVASPRYSCDGRTMCSQMSSCEEARFFLRNCARTQMDGDGDGVPCERQLCD
jgi:cold shock CspA family protein